jgi:hypothetical protein
MKRVIVFLFIIINLTILLHAQEFESPKYHLYDPSYVKYCQLALKVELQEVFLNGGMCGHKIYKVKEVLKGDYPYPFVRVFFCNLTETSDYVKDLVILSDGKISDEYRIKRSCWDMKDSAWIRQISGIYYVQDTLAITTPDPKKMTPIRFLQSLKNPYLTCVIIDYNQKISGWIKDEHLKELIQLLDSREKAIPVYESYNTDCTQYTSTIGIEALYMLEGFREGIYPPNRCSLGNYKSNSNEHNINFENRKKDILDWLKANKKYPLK